MPLLNDTSAPFGERTLAAIMFTDVVNFSALVGEKEDRTLAAVQRDFKLMSALIAQSNGNVLKTMGDGMLSQFASAVNAVACAQEIQLAIAEAAQARAQGVNLLHRIGIHLGDVFVTDRDIVGNGVNIAARLQTRAEPGGICISQTVFDVVKNKLTLEVNYLGPQELNHIREAIPAYMVLPRKAPAPAPRVTVQTPAVTEKPPRTAGLEFEIFTRHSGRSTASGLAAGSRRKSPLTLAVLADLSGRGSRAVVQPLAGRRALALDVDNFDEVFARLKVTLALPAYRRPSTTTAVTFESIDEFHPDDLLRRVKPLAELWRLRNELTRSATAAAAVTQLRALLAEAQAPTQPAGEPTRASESDTDTLSRLLARPAGASTAQSVIRPTTGASSLEALVRNLASASAPSAPVQDTTLEMAAADLEVAGHLRAILHHPDFQALEAAWRGLKLLVRDFGDDETVKLLVVDASRQELAADAAGLEVLLRELHGAVVIADVSFGADPDDLALLDQLARVAASTGLEIIAGIRPELVGCDSFARTPDPANWTIVLPTEVGAAWETVRGSPAAANVMLTAPRLLLRQPYGKGSDTIESFPFEELTPGMTHESYLWGNPAFACGHMLAAEFKKGGSSQRNFSGGELGGLPIHKFKEEHETVVKPCAEAWLTERAVEALRQRGVTALQSIKGRDAVRVTAFVSFANRSSKMPPT